MIELVRRLDRAARPREDTGIRVSTHVALVADGPRHDRSAGSRRRTSGPQTDRAGARSTFYRKVRPFGPGWEPIRARGRPAAPSDAAAGDNIPLALLGWVAGCTTIWSALFTVGNFLYGRTGEALFLLVVFAISGLVLLRVVQRLWDVSSGA